MNSLQIFARNPFLWSIHSTSSGGPVTESFEMNPHLSTHGTRVYSALPFNDCILTKVTSMITTGTSMAAPHVSGAAALMIQYSRSNGEQWNAEEIRARLMNSAMPFGAPPENPIQSGAGFANVYAAIHMDTVIYAYYDRVAQTPGVSFYEQDFGTTRTGLFSFGNVEQLLGTALDPVVNLRTLVGSIENNSNETRTYTLSHEFTHNTGNAARLTLSSRTITLGAGEVAPFAVAMSVSGQVQSIDPQNPRSLSGYFQGYITVRKGRETVARLPFGLFNHEETFNVDARTLSFNLGGTSRAPVTPASIDPINVNRGVSIRYFMEHHHPEFNSQWGGIPIDGLRREGYAFAGWYLDSNFRTPLTESTVMPNSAITLHARWTTGPTLKAQTWDELRNAVNATPAHLQTIIQIPRDLTTRNAINQNGIIIPADRNIILEATGVGSTLVGSWLTMLTPGQRHFTVYGQLTLTNRISLRGGTDGLLTGPNRNDSGGVVIHEGGTFRMLSDSSIQSVHRTSESGIVDVRGVGATFILDGSIIQNNSAPNGGGVRISENGYFAMMRLTSSINGNRVKITGGTFTMSGSLTRIIENTATNTTVAGGGGIFQSGGTVLVTSGEINSNRAPNGGGVRVAITTENAFTMTGGALRGNRAIGSNGDGGAIFAGEATLRGNPLPENSLPMLDIRQGVSFSGNLASGFSSTPPTNARTATRIQSTSSSATIFSSHPLNNWDINYRR